jgi:hypothetical protein
MRTLLLSVGPMLLVGMAYGLWRLSATDEETASALETCSTDDFLIGAPVTHNNLTIFPVVSRDLLNDDSYITLDEGLASGQVTVSEVGGGPVTARGVGAAPSGNVNRLVVKNTSSRPLYLMPGEIIVGGKQDRTLAESRVILGDGKPVEVPVFCVEHGRWRSRAPVEMASLASSFSAVKDHDKVEALCKKSEMGEMAFSGNTLNKAARSTVNEGTNQSEVWRQVGVANAKSGNDSASAAFTENYSKPNVQAQFEPYVAALESSVAGTDRIVGVVVAVNGRIEMSDVFGSTPLFRKLWPKLLKSYALDAATNTSSETKSCTADEARAFFEQARVAAVKTTTDHGNVQVTARTSDGVSSFCASACPKPTDSAAPASPPSSSIHTAAFAK